MTATPAAPRPDVNGVSAAGAAVYRPKFGGHLPALDGLRGLAVLLVLLLHFRGGDAPDGTQGLAGDIVARAPQLFWFGVDLFFVLSGFLITGILYDARGTPGCLRNFYARRVLRIFPLYYGVLLFIFVVAPLFRPLISPASGAAGDSPWWLWLYGTNLFCAWQGRDVFVSDWLQVEHFWSLAVEEHFYLVWPLVVLLLPRRALMAVCVALIAVALGLRLWLVSGNPTSDAAWVLTPCKMDALGLGAFLALAARGPGGLTAYVPWARRLAVACGLVPFALIVAMVLQHYDVDSERFVRTYGLTLFAVFFGAVLVLAVAAPPGTLWGGFWANPVLRFFGKYSYGIYVYHMLFLSQLYDWFHPSRLLPWCFDSWLAASVLFFLLATLVSTLVAWVSWHVFEKQILKLKVYFAYRGEPEEVRPPAAAATPRALEPLRSAGP